MCTAISTLENSNLNLEQTAFRIIDNEILAKASTSQEDVYYNSGLYEGGSESLDTWTFISR